MKSRYLIALLAAGLLAPNAFALMTGKAVAVITQRKQWYDWPGQPTNPSRLIVYSINNTVTAHDTILRGDKMYNPIWSFDGRRIAFYQNGRGVAIIDPDGRNMRTVAQNVDWANENSFHWMSWPGADGGKWLYYHKSCSGCFHGGSGEVWKVNVDDTTQNVKVCAYKQNNPNGWFNRFQLSADAKYCGAFIGGGNDIGCSPHLFPPANTANPDVPSCLPNSGTCDWKGQCNTGLSASGSIFYHFSGGHTAVYGHWWDHAAKTMTGWTGFPIGTSGAGKVLGAYDDIEPWLPTGSLPMGDCLVWPSGSSNSDKILTVITGWRYTDEYSASGSNLVVVNWKDKQAVMPTRNPDTRDGNMPPDNTLFWFSEPGDFWQQTPAGKEGCYEALDGTWVRVPGADTTPAITALPGTAHRNRLQPASGMMTIYNLKGALVGTVNTKALTRGMSAHQGVLIASTRTHDKAARVVLLTK